MNQAPAIAAAARSRRRTARRLLSAALAGGSLLLLAPVVLLAGAANPPCQLTSPTTATPGTNATPPAAGMFAAPLKLQPGRSYQVGATEYGGPGDPSSSDYGSIGGSQGFLPAHPDTFAELSVLDHNPANGATFTFADANALSNLPYLTALVVSDGAGKEILYKRDIGYGQGPGQFIANGQPYRLDIWWQSATPLRVSKTAVTIALAPPLGAGALLDQTPAPAATAPVVNPACDQLPASQPLKLVGGQQGQIQPDGSAAAPQDAPAQVKLAIAAANQIHTTYYRAQRPQTAGHAVPLV